MTGRWLTETQTEKRRRRARESRRRIAARATQVKDTLAYLYDQEHKGDEK